VDFASNDYLGMARAPRLAQAVERAVARGVPLGSGGSRLLRGNDPEHEALEAEAAAFFGSEAALFFSAGYAANAALLSTLPQRGDLIVHDELVHASMHEGLRLTRATAVAAAHNDPQAFDDAAREWRARGHTGRIWLAFETLYSMDGDIAPVDAFAEWRGGTRRSCSSTRPTPPACSAPTGAALPPISKAGPTRSSCAPAARPWAARARWCWGRGSCASSWSTGAAPSSSRPRHRRWSAPPCARRSGCWRTNRAGATT
jgi:hypothetical protein